MLIYICRISAYYRESGMSMCGVLNSLNHCFIQVINVLNHQNILLFGVSDCSPESLN